MEELMKRALESLSEEHDVPTEHLDFIGPWETGIGLTFLAFNILSEGHSRHKSTVAYRID